MSPTVFFAIDVTVPLLDNATAAAPVAIGCLTALLATVFPMLIAALRKGGIAVVKATPDAANAKF